MMAPHANNAVNHAAARPASCPGYQVCSRCVLDTSVQEIRFDENGCCNICTEFLRMRSGLPINRPDRDVLLEELITRIRNSGKGRRYDCVVGVSGGVDSTYVAYLTKKFGLRPLAVHFDNGWDAELAVNNIENIVKSLEFDLHTEVVDWDEFRDLQLAFLRASTPDSEIPTDHAIRATLIQSALREGVRYVISGSNGTTEGMLPKSWAYGGADWRYISSVHRRFGSKPLRTFPHYGLAKRLYYLLVRGVIFVPILNYVPYDKAQAIDVIERELGWRDYGGKHHESIYTRFFQSYILPQKFAIDKRRVHLSALVCSGQLSRDAALEELAEPARSKKENELDREYVVKKLGISESEFAEIMALPAKTYKDYPSYDPLLSRLRGLISFARRVGVMPERAGL